MNFKTKIIAHRGFSSVAPENTLVAFRKAIEIKADYIECDVHKAKDGSLVVIHDDSVDRTSSNAMKGKISDMTYEELLAVKVGHSTKFADEHQSEIIPTLRQALELAKGKIKVCIEIKVLGAEKEILEIVDELQMKEEVILFSFHYAVLVKIRKIDRRIPILFLIDKADQLTVEYAKIIYCNAIGVGRKTLISKEFLDFAHAQNLQIWKWTVNNEKEMQELIALGLDGIITNKPNLALMRLHKYQETLP